MTDHTIVVTTAINEITSHTQPHMTSIPAPMFAPHPAHVGCRFHSSPPRIATTPTSAEMIDVNSVTSDVFVITSYSFGDHCGVSNDLPGVQRDILPAGGERGNMANNGRHGHNRTMG